MPETSSSRPRCFDASLAVFPTRVIAVGRVIDLLAVPHGDAEERIEEFGRAMSRGDLFPPVAVVSLAGRLFLADGHKRLSACRSLGVTETVVEIWTARRWFLDQQRQLAKKTRQLLRLVGRSSFDASARSGLRRLALDTLGHWKRIAASLTRRKAAG